MIAISPVLVLTMVLCHSRKPSWLLVSIVLHIAKPVEILYIKLSVVPTRPLNPSISFIQNQISSSIVTVTLDWDPPSSTGGVSVSYVLTISPIPLSGSPVTMDTPSSQIIVSYNTPYDVTIRAVNCAGMSQESSIVDLSKLAISW